MLNFPRLATGQQKGEGQSWQIMRAGYGTQVRSADSEIFESDGGGVPAGSSKGKAVGNMGLGRRRERERESNPDTDEGGPPASSTLYPLWRKCRVSEIGKTLHSSAVSSAGCIHMHKTEKTN